MSELYTSLSHLKMAINGEVPPMTELPRSVKSFIDPALTIGMGALTEDAEKGLLCPVRECGVYKHILTPHLNKQHPEIGGASGLKALLEIPLHVPLVSSTTRARMREAGREFTARSTPEAKAKKLANLSKGRTAASRATQAETKARSPATMLAGTRNKRQRCEAQMRTDFVNLSVRLGRSPDKREAQDEFGPGYVWHVINVYGSWPAALAQFGLEFSFRGRTRKPLSKKLTSNAVVESVGAYYDRRGHLPTRQHAEHPTHGPLIPSRSAILHAMGTHSWHEAMRRIATRLNIYGGEWGMPESARPLPKSP